MGSKAAKPGSKVKSDHAAFEREKNNSKMEASV
jgi:hypothetical protein